MYLKKAIYAFMTLLILFGCTFMIALAAYLNRTSLLGIGLGHLIENGMIMALSLIGILRVIIEIIRIEHR